MISPAARKHDAGFHAAPPPRIPNLRWFVVVLLFAVTVINYLDRQVLSVAAPTITKEFKLSESDYAHIVMCFLTAYCVVQAVAGRLLDWIGLRIGLTAAVVIWSLACIGHAFTVGPFSLGAAVFVLGAAEASNWPAGVKAVAEWFPRRERAIAIGIFSSGSGLGAIIAPPLIAWLIINYGWRLGFVVTGAIGFIWLIPWLLFYRTPAEHPKISAVERAFIASDSTEVVEETADASRWSDLLRNRNLWGVIIARLCADPVWWFIVFWLPKYLSSAQSFDLAQIARFAWMPFFFAGCASYAGGLLSAFLVKRGVEVIRARKLAMLMAASVMPVSIITAFTHSPIVAVCLLTVAACGHNAWNANLITLPADLVPKKWAASAYGLSGAAGSVGGLAMSEFAGRIIGTVGYRPVLCLMGVLHLTGAAFVFLLIRSKKSESLVPTSTGSPVLTES